MTTTQERMWRWLRGDIQRVNTRINRLEVRTQRTETAGGVPASLLADAPRAAAGGMSDGSAYIDLLWIADGRKPGEAEGAGTGVLAVYSAGTDEWLAVHDYQAVTT